jgi:hypothetical protein
MENASNIRNVVAFMYNATLITSPVLGVTIVLDVSLLSELAREILRASSIPVTTIVSIA